MTPLSFDQWKKVGKALIYSFVSGFIGTMSLMALDFIHAASTGSTTVFKLGISLIVAATIGGINAVMVYVKQLFTEPE